MIFASLMFGPLALAAPANLGLIPQPTSVVQDGGQFTLGKDCRISASGPAAELGDQLAHYLRPATGFVLPVGRGGNGSINLHLDPKLKDLGAEGYRLAVLPDRVDVVAATPAGLFYSFQTIRELLPADIFRKAPITGSTPSTWTMPCVHIQDTPRFVWRGAMLDVSRHFERKSFVEKFIEEMAIHKLNTLHMHLADDQGWRIEIKKYPKLTANGSPTDMSTMEPKEATRSRTELPGGFFTQDDIREIVAYASARFITVVPEIEMPGHSGAAIAAYPELGNKLEIKAAGGDVSGMDGEDVYNVDDSTIGFLKDVMDEIMALFPSKFIHVGGDEVDKDPWKHNPKAQARMKEKGLKDEDQLESWFISQMDTYLASKGRRLIGWDEILEGGLAPGAAVMSWRGVEGGITASKMGHDVVMTPTSNTYFDYYQGKDEKKEPAPTGDYLPLRTAYAYEPIAPGLTPEQAKHVLGIQGQLWSEYIPGPKHLEYQAFPRLCALAEIGWSAPTGRTYGEFLTRLHPHLERLKIMDIAYRPLDSDDLIP